MANAVVVNGGGVFPPELVRWIQGGNPVRTDPSDPYAGRCGAFTASKSPCRSAAGFGTEYPGVGRCMHHPLEMDQKGLAPWVGEVPREEWMRLTGASLPGPSGLFEFEHGAQEIDKLPFDELLARHFDSEERAWWKGLPDDPVDRLDIAIKYRFVALGRINRALARQRALHNGVVPENKSLSYELTADKISQTIARLEEARAKYMDAQSGNEVRLALRDVLRGLSDEDYAAVKANPALLAQLTQSNL